MAKWGLFDSANWIFRGVKKVGHPWNMSRNIRKISPRPYFFFAHMCCPQKKRRKRVISLIFSRHRKWKNEMRNLMGERALCVGANISSPLSEEKSLRFGSFLSGEWFLFLVKEKRVWRGLSVFKKFFFAAEAEEWCRRISHSVIGEVFSASMHASAFSWERGGGRNFWREVTFVENYFRKTDCTGNLTLLTQFFLPCLDPTHHRQLFCPEMTTFLFSFLSPFSCLTREIREKGRSVSVFKRASFKVFCAFSYPKELGACWWMPVASHLPGEKRKRGELINYAEFWN